MPKEGKGLGNFGARVTGEGSVPWQSDYCVAFSDLWGTISKVMWTFLLHEGAAGNST